MQIKIAAKRQGWPAATIQVERSALAKRGESGQVYVAIDQTDGDMEHIAMWLSSKEVDTLITVLAFYKEQTNHDNDYLKLIEDTDT